MKMKYWLMVWGVFAAVSCCRAATDNKQDGDGIKVVSYNIRHGVGMDGRLELKRTAAVIKKLNPDIVALQEVDKNCKRSGERDIAAELGEMLGMESRFGKFMDFDGGEYGMAVLTRMPIAKTVRHQLPAGAEPRCALEVQVKTPGLQPPLAFVCIHNDWTSDEVRVRQINSLLDALEKREGPLMLVGDFNAEPADKSLAVLKSAGWRRLDKGGSKSWPADNPKVEIDHIIVKGLPAYTCKYYTVDERVASDHRPVFAEFKFKAKNSAPAKSNPGR